MNIGLIHFNIQYVYDAWGNIIAKSTGGLTDINPFRYRGYYMDVETGWYYLQTRYYDPGVRRFVNADIYELIPYLADNIGELNLYSYCNNNPVMYTDETGMFFLEAIAIGAIAKVIIAVIAVGTVVVVVEVNTGIISSTLDSAFTSLGTWIDSWGKSKTQTGTDIESNNSSEKYEPKRRGARVRGKSRKDAKEKAKKRGFGKPPIRHKGTYNKEGKWIGPHFHPNVPKGHPYSHDHYFYLLLLLELLFEEA